MVGDENLDCSLLLQRCIQAKGQEALQFGALLYHQYTALHGSVGYNHRRGDSVCVIWVLSRQQALAMSKTYTFSWYASHKTIWLGLKYFDFCTIGDIMVLG